MPDRPVRAFSLFFVLLVAAAPARAQTARDRPADVAARPAADSATVVVPFVRRPGDRSVIRLVKSRAERADGVLVDSVSGAWRIDARVLASRPRGFTFAWTYRPEGEDAAGPTFDFATSTLEGVPIVFRTDRTGQPFEIANGDSLRAALDVALRRFPTRSDPQRRALVDNVRATAATDAGLEALLLPDVERFHLVSGGRYPTGRPTTYRSALPNPFGGPPIPAVARFEATPAGRDSVATVRWRQTPDAEALARILVELLAEVSPEGPRLAPAEIARRFGVHEEATYRVGLGRGSVRGVSYRKDVRFGGRTRTERISMQTQRPQAPARDVENRPR